jgi:hypothetical protein
LRGDGAADVTCVALATGILDIQPDRVQLNAQILDVGVGQVSEGRNVSNRDGFFPFVELVSGRRAGCERSSVTKIRKTIAPAESSHPKSA